MLCSSRSDRAMKLRRVKANFLDGGKIPSYLVKIIDGIIKIIFKAFSLLEIQLSIVDYK